MVVVLVAVYALHSATKSVEVRNRVLFFRKAGGWRKANGQQKEENHFTLKSSSFSFLKLTTLTVMMMMMMLIMIFFLLISFKENATNNFLFI